MNYIVASSSLSSAVQILHQVRHAVVTAAIAILVTSSCQAVTFTDITSQSEILFAHQQPGSKESPDSGSMFAGGVAEDFDGNGYADLFMVQGNGPCELYMNYGTDQAPEPGTVKFVEEAAGRGAAVSGIGGGAAAADYDADGDIDICVTFTATSPVLLINNGSGHFTADHTMLAGLARVQTSPSWGDIDNDGLLDLAVASWGTSTYNQLSLFRNTGSGTLVPYEFQANPGPAKFSFSPRFADVNGDRLQDLLCTADFKFSDLYINNGAGKFVKTTDIANVGTDENGMGTTVGDFDNDGDLDWFVTSIYDELGLPYGMNWGITGNRLYLNNGHGVFADVTTTAGVRDGNWGWAATCADFDLDGDLDIFHVNGWPGKDIYTSARFHDSPARLFSNNGDGSFTDIAEAAGVDHRGQGRGVVAFDMENDGDSDLLICNSMETTGISFLLEVLPGRPVLLRNDGPPTQTWLGVKLSAALPLHPHGIGARVYAELNGQTQMRELHASTNYLSQDQGRFANFGFGNTTGTLNVRVEWPDGSTSNAYDVAANQYMTIHHTVNQADNAAAQQAVPVQALATASASASTTSNVVLVWNEALQNRIRAHAVSPPRASRESAIFHLAIFDAVNSTNPQYEPFYIQAESAIGASADAAAASAAHYILVNFNMPYESLYDYLLQRSLAQVPEGEAKTRGIAVGQQVAAAVLASRLNDNSQAHVNYTVSTEPGQWQPTPLWYQPALLPNWGTVTPFGISDVVTFRPAGPPALASQDFAQQLLEVQQLGERNSAMRTVEQTDIANFWADGPGTSTPGGHWNEIAADLCTQHNFNTYQNARLFALLNMALADAGIVCWEAKFHYNLWRPHTAIEVGGTEDWLSYLVTPNFPEYPSGHATFSAAAGKILSHFFSPDTQFVSEADCLQALLRSPDATRSFNGFQQAVDEAARSRIYGGIHYSCSDVDGQASGRAIADYIITHELTSLSGIENYFLY